jgi:hypothetical protein
MSTHIDELFGFTWIVVVLLLYKEHTFSRVLILISVENLSCVKVSPESGSLLTTQDIGIGRFFKDL